MSITLDRETEQQAERPPRRIRSQLVGALVLAAVGAGLLTYGGRGPTAVAPAGGDRALVDAEATTQVIGDVGSALTQIFSYGPRTLNATELASHDALTGRAAADYARLFAVVRQQAPAQKLVLTTRVVRAGVSDLSASTAHLLVFLDQLTVRAGKAAPVAAAQLSVTAQLRDGHWLISDFQAL
ncbi:MAG: hypothetical protein ABIS86_24155 [Streptosporangiaceae bacterium]